MRIVKILFGFLFLLSVFNEVVCTCNYYQILEPGKTYYIYNPGYPDASWSSCTWGAESPYPITLECSINIPKSYKGYCTGELTFQFEGEDNLRQYCGNGNFIIKGMNPNIELNTLYGKGKFLCQIYTEEPNGGNNCQCGWKTLTRIVGGTETAVNEYPFMAGLYYWQDRKPFVFCGATIISPRHIVTAAHCLENRNIRGFNIIVGAHDLERDNENPATQKFTVRSCKMHPDYKEYVNDIAICEIDGVIQYNVAVRPVCLPYVHRNELFVGKTVTALGWGLKSFIGPKATKLQKVDLKVIDPSQCQKTYPNLSKGNMCTYTEGKDACQMDSGGPFLWDNPNTGRQVLVGITSAGNGCASKDPAIETRVGAFIDWIESVTPGQRYCRVE